MPGGAGGWPTRYSPSSLSSGLRKRVIWMLYSRPATSSGSPSRLCPSSSSAPQPAPASGERGEQAEHEQGGEAAAHGGRKHMTSHGLAIEGRQPIAAGDPDPCTGSSPSARSRSRVSAPLPVAAKVARPARAAHAALSIGFDGSVQKVTVTSLPSGPGPSASSQTVNAGTRFERPP